MIRVLMVCTGNICRSTMAHQVLAEAVADAGLDVVVDSAGVSDEERGNPIDPRAARVLREYGHGVPDHRARQVQAGELAEWDLILAMTGRHLSALNRLRERAGLAVGGPAGAGAGGGRMGAIGAGGGLLGAIRVDGGAGGKAASGAGRTGRAAVCGAGGVAGPEIRMFRDFDPQAGHDLDLPDPWYGGHSDFVETIEVIERATPHIVEYLR